MATVHHVPTWDELTTAQRFQYAGNLDPWAGPVDPQAAARAARRIPPQGGERPDPCGCGRNDCGECGPRMAGGWRPVKGARRRQALRADADHLAAKVRHHEAQEASRG